MILFFEIWIFQNSLLQIVPCLLQLAHQSFQLCFTEDEDDNKGNMNLMTTGVKNHIRKAVRLLALGLHLDCQHQHCHHCHHHHYHPRHPAHHHHLSESQSRSMSGRGWDLSFWIFSLISSSSCSNQRFCSINCRDTFIIIITIIFVFELAFVFFSILSKLFQYLDLSVQLLLSLVLLLCL